MNGRNALRVLHGQRGHGGDPVAVVRGESFHVGEDAGPARRVKPRDCQSHSCWCIGMMVHKRNRRSRDPLKPWLIIEMQASMSTRVFERRQRPLSSAFREFI